LYFCGLVIYTDDLNLLHFNFNIMSKISIIAAVADNYAIGNLNKLPWHLPADLKHFRQLTTNHAVVMGKRTFESLLPSCRKE
jgi:hypothetical protein